MKTVNLYRTQQLAIAAAIDSGNYEKASDLLRRDLRTFAAPERAAPERSGTTGHNQTLTAPRKCGIIKAIRRNLRRMKRNQEEKKMYKWIEIYSIDNCIPDGMTAKAKATYNETEKVYEISRRAFLQACKRIGTNEHHARCNEDVYTQTGRGEGAQWYNLKDGIRTLTW